MAVPDILQYAVGAGFGGVVVLVLNGRKRALSEVASSTEVRDEIRGGVDKGIANHLKSTDFTDAVDRRIDHKARSQEMLLNGKLDLLRGEVHSMREMDAAWKVQHMGMHSEQSQTMRDIATALGEVRAFMARLDERTSVNDGES